MLAARAAATNKQSHRPSSPERGLGESRVTEDTRDAAPRPEDGAGQSRGAPNSDALTEIRQGIDALDREIVRLLNERGRLAERVGATKAERGAAIFAPDREAVVLGNVVGASAGPLTASH